MGFRIAGTGSAVPDRVVTNDELSKYVETSHEWIFERTGIAERRVCEHETAAQLATVAARAALHDAGLAPTDLDYIFVATTTPDHANPALSYELQKAIGATCPCLDFSAGCSTFIYLVDVADAYILRNPNIKILLVAAERISRVLDWTDRSTCVLFGDGAGAAVLEGVKGEGSLLAMKLFSHGDTDTIRIPALEGNSPFNKIEQRHPFLHMDGQETFKFAVGAIVQDIKDVLSISGLQPSEINHAIPHQANNRIISAAIKKLGINEEKWFVNIDKYGNTASASVPLALDELNKSGKLKRGDLLVLSAFGGGLSSASCVLRW